MEGTDSDPLRPRESPPGGRREGPHGVWERERAELHATGANCTQGGSASSSAPPHASSGGPLRGARGVAGRGGDAFDDAAAGVPPSDRALVAAAAAAAAGKPAEAEPGGDSPAAVGRSQSGATRAGIAKHADEAVSQVLSVPSPNGSQTLDVASDAVSVDQAGRTFDGFAAVDPTAGQAPPEAEVVAAAVIMAEAHVLSVASQAVAAQAKDSPLEELGGVQTVLPDTDSERQPTPEPEERADAPAVACQPRGHAESAPGAEPSQPLGERGAAGGRPPAGEAAATAAAVVAASAALPPAPVAQQAEATGDAEAIRLSGVLAAQGVKDPNIYLVDCPVVKERYGVSLKMQAAEKPADVSVGDAITFVVVETAEGRPRARAVQKEVAPATPPASGALPLQASGSPNRNGEAPAEAEKLDEGAGGAAVCTISASGGSPLFPGPEREAPPEFGDPVPEKLDEGAGGAAICTGLCSPTVAAEAELAEARAMSHGAAHGQPAVLEKEQGSGVVLTAPDANAAAGLTVVLDQPPLSAPAAVPEAQSLHEKVTADGARSLPPVAKASDGDEQPGASDALEQQAAAFPGAEEFDITPADLMGRAGCGTAALPAAPHDASLARHVLQDEEAPPPPTASIDEGTREDAPANEPRRQGQQGPQDSSPQQQQQQQRTDPPSAVGRVLGPVAGNDEYVVHVHDVYNTGTERETAPLVGIGGTAPSAQLLAVPNDEGDNTLNSSAALLDLLGFGDTSFLFRGLKAYCRGVARCPGAFIFTYFSIFVVFMLIRIPKWMEFEVETDFNSFIRADGVAMREREAYTLAFSEKQGLGDSGRRLHEAVDIRDLQRHPGRRLGTSVFYMGRDLHVVYVAKNGDAFDAQVLAEIHDFENRLRANQGFREACDQAVSVHGGFCDPGWSLIAYTWPTPRSESASSGNFTAYFNSRGSDMFPLPAAFAYMQEFTDNFVGSLSSDVAPTDFRRFFPKDYETPPILGDGPLGAPRPKAIKSTFTFNIYLGKAGTTNAELDATYDEKKAQYRGIIAEKIWPFLSAAAAEYDHVSIFYYGDEVTAHEIMSTLRADAMWALASVAFILCYLRFHTGDTFVSCVSLAIIFASVPLAYVLTPMAKVTVASFLSLFVMMGVGSDVVFVFTDFWHQGRRMPDIPSRLGWMLLHAGRSCLATSITTSVSFFANLKSALQTLREFGLFMGLCVMSVFFLVLLFLPPVLVIVERRNAEREQRVKVKSRSVDIAAGESSTLSVVPIPSNSSGGRKVNPTLSTSSGVSVAASPRKRKQKGPPVLRGGRMLLFKLVNLVGLCPATTLIFTTLMVGLWFFFLYTNAQREEGAPEIFPQGHNQIESTRWAEQFYEFSESMGSHLLPPEDAQVCEPQVWGGQCDMYWCFMQTATVYGPGDGSGGACWHGAVTDAEGQTVELSAVASTCTRLRAHARAASNVQPNTGAWHIAWEAEASAAFLSGAATNSSVHGDTSMLPYLAMEDWAPGTVSMVGMYRMPTVDFSTTVVDGPTCEVHSMCFLGLPVCDMPADMVFMGNITLDYSQQPVAVRRLERHPGAQPGRVLQDEVPPRKRMLVTVLWGIRAALATPVVGPPQEFWTFDPTFEPSNPWAQRAIWAVCADPWTQYRNVLEVLEAECWIDSFRSWLRGNERKFPSRDFDNDVAEWWATEPVIAPASIWMVRDVMRACKVEFAVNKPDDMSSGKTLDYKALWAQFVDRLNAQASVTANFAYHTSQAWVRAEAEQAIVGSTKETIIISATCAWLGVLLFTLNLLLACLVTALVLGIIIGLAFFMVLIMGWKIGPIEVIALVVFVGYSVTYSLHIAHNYSEIGDNDRDALELEEIAKNRKASTKKKPFAGSGASRYSQLADGPATEEAIRPASATAASRAMRSTCQACGGFGCGLCNAGGAKASKDAPTIDTSQMDDRSLRLARTRAAVLYVGGATLSSAISTVGSSFFLLLCTLNIFGKLGLVVIAVTILSIIFAMFVLPAALICFGPLGETWYQRFWRRLAETSTARKLVEKWKARRKPVPWAATPVGGAAAEQDPCPGFQVW